MEVGAWRAEFEACLYDYLTAGFGLEGRDGFNAAGGPLAVVVFRGDEEGLGGGELAVVAVAGVAFLLAVGGGAGEAVPFGGIEGTAGEIIGPDDIET